jgi:hypothetical protein
MPPNPPKNEWKALAGRISVFPMAPLSPPASVLDLYRGVWQHEPDEFHKQPNPLMPSVAQGRISNVVANCMVQPSRIDFGLQPVPPANMSFAAIEDTIQLRNELERIISAIGKGAIINPIVRVGVFLNFIILAPNFLEANKILLGSMPSMYRPGIADEEDFSFQINRSRAINEIDNVTMNFITRWSVNRF